ncbi:MAG: hypothetical protein JKY01_06425 [Pseudomonadales bacterium]|nr:hypothetical protein [Pseudomonadales bacterium]
MTLYTQKHLSEIWWHFAKLAISPIFAFGLCLLIAPGATVADISIVVSNTNNNKFSSTIIRKLFMGKRNNFPDGTAATPLIQDENTEITHHFNLMLLSRSPQQYKAYWARIIFTGQGYPPEQAYSDAEIIEKIKADPSIISYIHSSSLTSRVKEVLRISGPPNNEKTLF